MKQQVLLFVVTVAISCNLLAQSAINLKVGVLDRKFVDEVDSGSTLIHYGQSYGFDMIVEDSRLLFMPGLHYQHYSIAGADSRGGIFHKRKNIHQISLPISFGTGIAASRWVKFRIYGGGHINFIVGVDQGSPSGLNLDRVTTVHPGWQGGAQIMLWRVTADVRYYKDFRKVINVREDSTLHGWEVLVGIAF